MAPSIAERDASQGRCPHELVASFGVGGIVHAPLKEQADQAKCFATTKITPRVSALA